MSYQRLVSRLTKENLWLYILKELSHQSTYAYELAKIIKNKYQIPTAKVTTYVVLYKMEREGLIRATDYRRLFRRPGRKYYNITDQGSKQLEEGKAFIRHVLTNFLDDTSTV